MKSHPAMFPVIPLSPQQLDAFPFKDSFVYPKYTLREDFHPPLKKETTLIAHAQNHTNYQLLPFERKPTRMLQFILFPNYILGPGP